MFSFDTVKKGLTGVDFDSALTNLYGASASAQKERYLRVLNAYGELYGTAGEVGIFSAPGRSEVCGNHTDHNHGKVLAAAINLDAIAVAAKNNKDVIRLKSEGYDMDMVDITDLNPNKAEYSKSKALIRGVCAGFVQRGYEIGGFDAATANDVLSGSGLSSSAAFEVLVGTILNHLYNDGRVTPVEIAQIAQYAENEFFGKPCGLLDQMTCSVGGFVFMDFRDPTKPYIKPVKFDFDSCAHALCIVNTGGSHSNLTDEYAAVKNEMISVAQRLGHDVLREVDEAQFYNSIDLVRDVVGDRAILRAKHFFSENRRVDEQVKALESKQFGEFKKLVVKSGQSSYMYNQNVYSVKDPLAQPVSLGLCLCEELLDGKGAWRVHGGGFAGTIQAFVPVDMLNEFKHRMELVFGEKSCYVLSIRPVGGVNVI
ncbi:MAG: galactokinase [Clostridia bacterium]|nr:galactokinase [Clostridia bacterium]